MPLLKGNLHTHTTLSDGTMSPEEVLSRYRDLGYDFVAFTDHRSFIGYGIQETLEYWAKLPASTPEMIVLWGVEEEPPEIGGKHANMILAGEEELWILNHPSEYEMSVEDVVSAIAKVGAHAVEITKHGRYLAEYDVGAITVPKIATDDMHHVKEVGVSWIAVDAERDPVAILRAIKAGRFEKHIGRR